MHRVLEAFALCALAVVTAAAAVAAEPMQLVVDGQTRAFVLARQAAPEPRPTLIVLHGGGGSGACEAQSELGRLGPEAGLVLVFPDARAGRWNNLPPGKESARYARVFQQHGGPPDDVAFLKALVADLVGRGISDPERIYLAGISAGGIMTLRMVCMGDATFAAIALLVTSMPEPTAPIAGWRSRFPC